MNHWRSMYKKISKQHNVTSKFLFVDFSKTFDSINRGKMEQILLVYGLPKETVTNLMMLYKNMKAIVCSLDGDTHFFDIVAGILQEDILEIYLWHYCWSLARRYISFINVYNLFSTMKVNRSVPILNTFWSSVFDEIQDWVSAGSSKRIWSSAVRDIFLLPKLKIHHMGKIWGQTYDSGALFYIKNFGGDLTNEKSHWNKCNECLCLDINFSFIVFF